MSDAQPMDDEERRAVEKLGAKYGADVVLQRVRERRAQRQAEPSRPANAGQAGAGAGAAGGGDAYGSAKGAASEIAGFAGKVGRFARDEGAEMLKEEVARTPSRLIMPVGGHMVDAPAAAVLRQSVLGDKPVAESMADGLVQGGLEVATGLATEGAGRLVGKVGRSLIDTVKGNRGVTKLAKEVGEAAAAPGVAGQPTPRSFYEKSLEISKQAKSDVFSPAEMTGDPALALAESKALQFPKTMRTAQAQRHARLQNTARFLDGITDSIAADPTKLGTGDMAEAAANAVERHGKALRAARSEEATPLYAEAERLLGDKKVAPIDEVAAFISTELDRAVGPFQKSRAPLKETLDALQKDSKGGFANIKTVRSLAEQWGQQIEGTGDLLADLSIAQRQRIASKMTEMLNRSIDVAAESGKATDAGVQALRKAQGVWAKHSQAIEELPLEALSKVLKVGSGEASDTLIDRMSTLSDKQIRGVMRVIRKNDPAAAQQLGAEYIESLLVRTGKPARGASIAADIGAAELKPGQALNLLGKHESKIRALYDGDGKSMLAFTRIMETLKRKTVGPGLRGSQTAPLLAQAMEDAGDSMALAAAGPQAGVAMRVVRGLLGSDKALASAVTDPAKLKLLDEAIQAQLQITNGSQVPAATMRGLATTANRLGIFAAETKVAEDERKPPRESMFANTRQ